MSMKRINQIFGGIMLTYFLFMAYTAHTTLIYWSDGAFKGPGSGFFPFWINLILAGMTIYWMVQVTIRPGEKMPEGFIPTRRGGVLVLLVFMDMVLFTLILDYIGFPVSMFFFVLIMVAVLGERTLRDMIRHALFSVAVTAFFMIVFGRWLEVIFPKSEIGILNALGL